MVNIWIAYKFHFSRVLGGINVTGIGMGEEWCYRLVYLSVDFSINELSLVFVVLISFLYPVILLLMQHDLGASRYKYYGGVIWLYWIIYVFLFTADLLVFYIVYELMIGLVFYIMFLTANNRGSVEAILYFIGWASLGSLLVGIAVIYIIANSQTRLLSEICRFSFGPNERYFLYICFFFGFGTKLSV